MNHRTIKVRFVCFLMFVGWASAVVAHSGRPQPSFEFRDSTGKTHTWRVNDAHTLVWNGRPWIPVGGMFFSYYLAYYNPRDGQSNERNWQRDMEVLQALRQYGVTDFYLNPYVVPFQVPTVAWRRALSSWDRMGFTYGIEIDAFREPRLIACRAASPQRIAARGIISLEIPATGFEAVHRVLCLLLDPLGRSKPRWVRAAFTLEGETARISLDLNELAKRQIVVCPVLEGTLKASPCKGLPDLWSCFPAYRSDLVEFIRRLPLGPGFRFFVDPIVNEQGFDDDAGDVFPRCREFQRQYEQWLRKKYRTLGSLNHEWRIRGKRIRSFSVASQCLWLKGANGLCDLDRRNFYPTGSSKPLSDILCFRDESVANFNTAAANAIKRVVNVPVVFKSFGTFHRSLINYRRRGGLDGIGWEPYGVGPALITNNGQYAYSEIEHSRRPLWSVVTETAYETASPTKTVKGYPDRPTMVGQFNTLLSHGAKGIYVFTLNDLSAPAPYWWQQFTLVDAPEQLRWLGDYRRLINEHGSLEQLAAYHAPRSLDVRPPTVLARAALAASHGDQLSPGLWTGFEQGSLSAAAGDSFDLVLAALNRTGKPVVLKFDLALPDDWKATALASLALNHGQAGRTVARVRVPESVVARDYPVGGTVLVANTRRALSPSRVRVSERLAMELVPSDVSLADLTAVSLRISNSSASALSGMLELQPPSGWTMATPPSRVGPLKTGAQQDITFKVLEKKVVPFNEYVLTPALSEGGHTTRCELPLDFTVCNKAGKPISLDGKLDDWEWALPLHLRRRDQVVDLVKGWWRSPSDASAVVYTQWDEKYLHLAAKVHDRKFYQPFDDENLWQGDGIQIAIDGLHDRSLRYDEDNHEFQFAFTERGPVAWRWQGPSQYEKGRVASIVLRGQTVGDETIYEVAIPWEELTPLRPTVGKPIGWALIVNNNNGEGKLGWLEWGSGLGTAQKQPWRFSHLTFRD